MPWGKPAIRQIIRSADPAQPISEVRTLEQIVESETARRSVQLHIISAFAAVAFLLAAVGIHGLLAYAVSHRTAEIGVRLALGAQRRDILAMVLRHAGVLALAGIVPGVALGVALAYAAGRMMESILARVQPDDPLAFATAVALAAVMTVAGSFLPALRAIKVDPIQAIRS